MATIAIRNGNTGAVTPASGPLDVVTAIDSGADILVDGQTAILSNVGGNWLINGQPVGAWFMVTPTTGPTVAPVDWMPTAPPMILPAPIIRTDPFPVTAAGSLNLTPGTLVVLAAAAYFLFFRRSS